MDTLATILISLALLFLIIASFVDTRKAKKKLRQRISQSWGKQPEAKYSSEDLESIASYFLNHKKKN